MTDEQKTETPAEEQSVAQPSEADSLTGIKGKIIKASEVGAGNTIRVHQKISEVNAKGEMKDRIQIYQGIVLGVRGAGVSKTMTVRKISEHIGVEKIFPLNLPSIVAIELLKVAEVRRAKLPHLRTSKKKLREKMITA